MKTMTILSQVWKCRVWIWSERLGEFNSHGRVDLKTESHRNPIVYQKFFEAGSLVFELSKQCPREEPYSLTDQVRRFAKNVSADIAEAWRKRRNENHLFADALRPALNSFELSIATLSPADA